METIYNGIKFSPSIETCHIVLYVYVQKKFNLFHSLKTQAARR